MGAHVVLARAGAHVSGARREHVGGARPERTLFGRREEPRWNPRNLFAGAALSGHTGVPRP